MRPHVTLSNWLLLVAAMRGLAVVLGYTYPAPVLGQNLETQLFDVANPKAGPDAPDSGRGAARGKKGAAAAAAAAAAPAAVPAAASFTPLAGRTFAVWTAVTCVVCVGTAADPSNASLLRVCGATFVAALGYFAGEFFVYRTVSLRTVIRPAIIACEYAR